MPNIKFEEGLVLEHRVLRLFFARGIFAERSLLPAVGDDYQMKATDIDVLAAEYGAGFHAKRINVECKSGKNVSKLDRILWLAGVQALIKSDVSHFLVQDAEYSISQFGKQLNVFTFSEMQLRGWENALGLSSNWFARSNFELYEIAASRWSEGTRHAKGEDADWLLFKDVNRFLKSDSWLGFSYSNLNRLFRLSNAVALCYKSLDIKSDKALCARYSVAALFVRFTQFLVEICEDVISLPNTKLSDYLEQCLMHGDNKRNPGMVVQQTLAWVEQALKMRGIQMPHEISAERLNASPPYSDQFVRLVRKCLERSSETPALPITAELMMFSTKDERWTNQLQQAYLNGEHLALTAKSFFLRCAGASPLLLDNLTSDLLAKYTPAYKESIKAVVNKSPSTIDDRLAAASNTPQELPTIPLPQLGSEPELLPSHDELLNVRSGEKKATSETPDHKIENTVVQNVGATTFPTQAIRDGIIDFVIDKTPYVGLEPEVIPVLPDETTAG